MPDTLFNMVKNRQVRPNTPFLWTYARDETYGMTTDWIKGRSNPGHVLQSVRNDIMADQDRFLEIYSPEVQTGSEFQIRNSIKDIDWFQKSITIFQ